jgi:hypothetical protein
VASYWGSFIWGLVVDETPLVPALPGVMLAKGGFAHSVEMITGHNSNEGYLFASILVLTEAD